MFYDKFIKLCEEKKTSPSRAALEAGISKSLVTKWKTNNIQVPSSDILQKLSAYFNVPVSYLLGEEGADKKEKLTAQGDELSEAKRNLIQKIMSLKDDQVQLLLQVAERIG